MNGSIGSDFTERDTPQRRHRSRMQQLHNQASNLRSTAKALRAQHGENLNYGIKRQVEGIAAQLEATAKDVEVLASTYETLNRVNPEN